jgi:uncharacterized protein YbaP (TraB family)
MNDTAGAGMIMRILLSLALLLSCCNWAAAASSVWKAQKGSTVIYLGGTFHLLRPTDYPLPVEFDRAFKAADIIVFETDIDRLNEPSTQIGLLAQGVYADGSGLESHLTPGVYRELSAYCQANGFPLQMFRQMKPSLLLTTLLVLELKSHGVDMNGVDQHYFELAAKEKKSVASLETVGEQLAFLVSLSDGIEDEFVKQSLRDLQSLDRQFTALTAAWRKGDSAVLEEYLIAEVKTKLPMLYRRLISDRNSNWLKTIDGYEKTKGTRFILVGAAHLVGPDGLVAALKRKGYKVEPL